MSTVRYAVYYAPEANEDLHRFGAAVLGYDARLAAPCAQWCPQDVSQAQWAQITAEPRRYGFHATLKAPFRLAQGVSEPQLMEAVAQAVALQQPFNIALQVHDLHGFIALVPEAVPAELADLEARVVEALEPCRAPLNAAELERRLASPLSARQTAYLERYGYPYVLEEFRFHMTLTGRLPQDLRAGLLQSLRQAYAERVSSQSARIHSVSVFRQDDTDRPFQILRSVSF